MRLSFFDSEFISPTSNEKVIKKLQAYRAQVAKVIHDHDLAQPEYSLINAQEPDLHETLAHLATRFAKIDHLILVGIGGSSLGVEAVHSVLDTGAVTLTTLDTVAPNEIASTLLDLQSSKRAAQVAVCVVSKSGNTAETLTNASVVLEALKGKWGEAIYAQTIFVGDAGTEFMKAGKRLGVTCVAMPAIVGGRYSVATAVGLVPLTLLKHDVDAFIEGYLDAGATEFEHITAESAARIYQYIQKGYRHYNFFAFEKRLYKLGAWYRQLNAESLGKALDKAGASVTKGMLPTITTPVELHSIGQLYLSGFPGVYTDFVTFDNSEEHDFKVPKAGLAKAYGRFTLQDVATAIYGGVIGAYHDKQLPFRTTIFDDNLAYSLGLFMSMRLREIMYIAHLMNLNAFDQPNVESYKIKTKEILGL